MEERDNLVNTPAETGEIEQEPRPRKNISDPNQATSQPMGGGGIGSTDEGRDRDVGDDAGSKDDLGGDERAAGSTYKSLDDI
jgi:hypothetical protein